MSDRELLGLAAKAAGIADARWSKLDDGICYGFKQDEDGENYSFWNPLTDDGDALRLAVKLWLDVAICQGTSYADGTESVFPNIGEPQGADPYAATRRAIVRAAAAIGKEMP